MNPKHARIMELYGTGMLLKDIAADVGVAPNYVGVILKRLGVDRPSKPQKKRKSIDDADVVKLWDGGLSTSAIAERCGVPCPYVRSVLVRAGRDIKSVRRLRYDGRAGTAHRSGNAFARIARRT